ncbi:glycosyltransferase family 4 protein [Natrinema hispanicum]|uniref:Glycosyltransferase involved in cell wall bisynthesis n=1 Tax=Natrinema hispanicum TaxID=392421 RepID=A0A1G6URX0_9EURY|nr:glycosyltransferase family 4 protein [Natrinema hispanicum]SDD43984.1 Glycosyltransferase involved in cell wall bisynthesis [Natrinema hispanicum]
MESTGRPREDILVVSTSNRGEKITRPLSSVGVETSYFQIEKMSDVPELYQTIQNHKPEVVIIDSFSFGGASVALSCLVSSTPYVIRVRGDPVREHIGWVRTHIKNREFLRALKQFPRYIGTKLTFLLTNNYIFVSDYLKDRYDVNGDRSVVINTPCFMLDEASDGAGGHLNLNEDVKDHVVLAVMNMNYPAKVAGLQDALDPISTVLESRGDTTMLIAGDGPYYEEITEQCENLEGDIRTLGYVSNIEALFERADVFVHFSYLDGYPSTILEAYASKTAVLANDAVGMSEQIVDGKTGYLVDLDESAEITDRLNILLRTPEKREEFAKAGYERVHKINTTEAIGEKFHSYLSRIRG